MKSKKINLISDKPDKTNLLKFPGLTAGTPVQISSRSFLWIGDSALMSLLSRVAYEQSFDTCFRVMTTFGIQVWSVFTTVASSIREQNRGPVAENAILENFPRSGGCKSARSVSRSVEAMPLQHYSCRFNDLKVVVDSLFFHHGYQAVLSGNRSATLCNDVIFLSERFAKKIFGDKAPSESNSATTCDRQPWTYATIPRMPTIIPRVISMPTTWGPPMETIRGMVETVDGVHRFRPSADCSVVNKRIDAMIEKYHGRG